jgi:hypothetical protein
MQVFVSHLHAEYCRKKDIYLGHRVLQVAVPLVLQKREHGNSVPRHTALCH